MVYNKCMDNKARNTDFFITRATEVLAELEQGIGGEQFTEDYLRIRAILTVLLEPTSGFEEPERQAIKVIESRARELMEVHDSQRRRQLH